MKIADTLRADRPSFSFEFFAPKTDAGIDALLQTAKGLRIFSPSYVSVTYGAGGSSRARTIDVAKRIKRELEIEVLAHVTCVGTSRDDLRRVFDDLAAGGIENVLALRGDPPKGEDAFVSHADGFSFATELIEFLRAEYGFGIGAAAYPERHPESPSLDFDIEIAKRKVDRGAHFLVTQFFFDNDAYFSFVSRAREAGIEVPIVPGIMPITNYEQIARMTKMIGTTLPQRLLAELEARFDEPEAIAELGVAYSALQCSELLAKGAPGIHFYTLNKSPATRAVLSALIAARAAWDRRVLGARAAVREAVAP